MLKNTFVKKALDASQLMSNGDRTDGVPQQKCTIRFLDDNSGQTTLPFKVLCFAVRIVGSVVCVDFSLRSSFRDANCRP